MSRTDQIVELLRYSPSPLDDDEIGLRLNMNRHYVNRICRGLAVGAVIDRYQGQAGKFLNQWISVGGESPYRPMETTKQLPGPRMPRVDLARFNVEALIDSFKVCVDHFEHSNAFTGPSLYFHKRAIERRLQHQTPAEALADEQLLEYIYAVLPAWGMHRMGNQAAKVGSFDEMVESFRSESDGIERLWTSDIRETDANSARSLAAEVWSIITALRVSTSKARIVAGTKALHHMLPDLVPPIDRQYTYRFFTGRGDVVDQRSSFLEWFPMLCEIGHRCRGDIAAVLTRGGMMATSPSKVIDNAIVGFMKRTRAVG